MKKKLLCIIGETARGKDTAAKYLEEKYGLKGVVSYTTRPIRPTETQGKEHHFIDKTQADYYLKNRNICALTTIGEYLYFATDEELANADYYIIDPHGIDYLQISYHNPIFKLYVTCYQELAKQRFIERGGSEIEYNVRAEAESAQFSYFAKAKNYDYIIQNNGSIEEFHQELDKIGQMILNNFK